jgi:NAD(P)-dependent dehydrogenase (short-subunit alcohol dehydrogenase family)
MNSGESFTLLTGASSALGAAIALRLSPDRRLILSGRNEARLAEIRDACASPERHLLWVRDLSPTETLQESLVDLLRSHALTVDGFIHCAGIPSISAVSSLSHATLKKAFDVNFSSAALITSTLARKQVNALTLAHVVFVSSIFSRFGVKGHSVYCATKAALDGLMRALAVELAPRVRVNSILPGAIPSPMAAAALSNEQTAAALRKSYPLGLGTPEAIAAAAAFLFSSDAAWITGQEFVVDGGRTIYHAFE